MFRQFLTAGYFVCSRYAFFSESLFPIFYNVDHLQTTFLLIIGDVNFTNPPPKGSELARKVDTNPLYIRKERKNV